MKENTCLRMGYLRIGIPTLILIVLLVLGISVPIMAQNIEQNNQCDEPTADSTRANNIWYIYRTKEFIDNRTFTQEIVINGSGELRITNSSTFTLSQDWNYQRNISVQDDGALFLSTGTLVSNKALLIKLRDNGKIILEQNSKLIASKIFAIDNSIIQSISSKISPGADGLLVDVSGDSVLDLTDSTIENANSVKGKGNSVVIIKNSAINSVTFELSCKELRVTSNPNYRDLKIDRCEKIYITDSTVYNLQISTCTTLQVTQNSKLENSEIIYVGELDIDDCTITNVEINKIDTSLTIQNSNVSSLKIMTCGEFEIYDTHLQNSELNNFADLIEIYDSVITKCSLLPKHIRMFDSTLEGTATHLDKFGRANVFEAYNSTFSRVMNFAGNSQAHLVNCDTAGNTPPEVNPTDDAVVYLYWWLDITVVDAQNQPLEGTNVVVYDFLTDLPVIEGITNYEGKVKFKLLANTKTKNGWNTPENNPYYIKADYQNKHVEDNVGLFLEKNTAKTLKFTDVNKKETEEEPLLTMEMIIGIIILIIVIILIVASVMSSKSKNKGTRPGMPEPRHPEYPEDRERPEPRRPPGLGPQKRLADRDRFNGPTTRRRPPRM